MGQWMSYPAVAFRVTCDLLAAFRGEEERNYMNHHLKLINSLLLLCCRLLGLLIFRFCNRWYCNQSTSQVAPLEKNKIFPFLCFSKKVYPPLWIAVNVVDRYLEICCCLHTMHIRRLLYSRDGWVVSNGNGRRQRQQHTQHNQILKKNNQGTERCDEFLGRREKKRAASTGALVAEMRCP